MHRQGIGGGLAVPRLRACLQPAGCGPGTLAGFVILAVPFGLIRTARRGELRVLGDEDHRHDMDREARDQLAEGAAACWSCRVALLVRL